MEEAKREQKGNKFIIPMITAVALAVGIFIGTLFIPQGFVQNKTAETTTKFNAILEIIENNYVDSVDHELLIESSIEGMIQELDPHSSYIPATDLDLVNEQLDGKFGGVGIRFLIHDDTLVATHVLENSPSEAAGMLPGDRLIEVDGEDITTGELDNLKVMDLLKGEEGSIVNVTVHRKGVTKTLEITRGSIPVSSIDAAIMISDDIGFIKLNSFTFNSDDEFRQAAGTLKEKGMKKLIFDLRNNGGGYLSAATDIADQFLKTGKLIVYTEGRTKAKKEYYSTNAGILHDTEVIILINSMSASASEIVAGAIQDNDRGLIMGRRSFGKGLVQEQSELKDGSALRLTVSRYYTPTGRSIQKPYGEGVDYNSDYMDRYESGELMHEDSIKFDESLKFITPAGRTVYGGGGIYPDVFIPNDTAGASYYLTNLYYAGAFNHYAVKYLDFKRKNFKDMNKFLANFKVSASMFEGFINYATTLGVEEDPYDIVTSRYVIKNRIKAELARHIWQEEGYYNVYIDDDLDVQKALTEFRKGGKLLSHFKD